MMTNTNSIIISLSFLFTFTVLPSQARRWETWGMWVWGIIQFIHSFVLPSLQLLLLHPPTHIVVAQFEKSVIASAHSSLPDCRQFLCSGRQQSNCPEFRQIPFNFLSSLHPPSMTFSLPPEPPLSTPFPSHLLQKGNYCWIALPKWGIGGDEGIFERSTERRRKKLLLNL
jgi:hypothetical protein